VNQDNQKRSEARAFYAVAWVFYLVLATGGIVWLGARQGEISWRLFLRPATAAGDLGLAAASTALLLGVWYVAYRFWPSARRLERELRAVLGPITGDQALALGIFSGIAEEVFFRGAMLSAWGWIPATLVFALLHAGGGRISAAWMLFATLAGLLFAGLVLWRETLLAPIVAHAAVNAIQLRRLGREAPSAA